MERKGRLRSNILNIGVYCAIIYACIPITEQAKVTINFHGAETSVRSVSPDEDKITDISLLIFDEKGNAEDCIWLSKGQRSCSTDLLTNKKYTFCACANFGHQVYADHMDELQELSFYIAYPDEYREGIPMQ